MTDSLFTNLQSLIYPTKDIKKDTKLWTKILGKKPYFKNADYVGFDIDGDELGLFAHAAIDTQPVTYIGVTDFDKALNHLKGQGAEISEEPMDVGDGVMLASLQLPNGQLIGIIFNPNRK